MTTVHYQDLDMEGVDFSKDFNFTFPPLLAGISSFDVGHINLPKGCFIKIHTKLSSNKYTTEFSTNVYETDVINSRNFDI